jgi:hypothetical protein
MSETTKANLERALHAHIANEEETNPVITGYVLAASLSYVDDDSGAYWFDAQDNQAAHVSRGLTALLSDWMKLATEVTSDDD